jgi:DNA-binding NarL/FixJ family response regulator
MPATSIRVMTVDHQPLVREGLAAVINQQPDMSLVAGAGSGMQAIHSYREHRPDVAILDLLLPDMPGETVAMQIRAEFPQACIVVLTSARGDVRIGRALAAGVRGYVLKETSSGELVDVIRKVHAGKKMIVREVATEMADHIAAEMLTRREIEVLRLVATGHRNKEIAGELEIAEETVCMHMKNILGKLGAHDRTHAVTIAVTRGIFDLPDRRKS